MRDQTTWPNSAGIARLSRELQAASVPGGLKPRIRADATWLTTASPLMAKEVWDARSTVVAESPSHLIEALAGEQPRKVGRYFEALHDAMLAREVEIVALQRPIRDGKRTLGELDGLYRDRLGAVVHREIAVKYYLGVRGRDDWRDWVGPNRRDRLDMKIERLATHQLCLPKLARELGVWPATLPFPERGEVLLVGAFFRHPSHSALPRGAHARVDAGFWCHASEFASLATGQAWVVLPKPWWLSPAQVGFESPAKASAIVQRVEQQQRPVMVGGPEQRGFVVPDGWWKPAKA